MFTKKNKNNPPRRNAFFIKPKKFVIISSVIFLFAAFFNLAAAVIYAPSSLKLLPGAQNEIFARFPFNAIIKSVSNGDSVEASGSEDESISQNVSLSVNGGGSVSASAQAGSLDMSLTVFGVPVKTVQLDVLSDTEVIPCGKTVGVRISTAGIMVLGLVSFDTEDGKSARPSDGKLRSGDLITAVKTNGQNITLENKEQFQQIVDSCGGNELTLTIKRDGGEMTVKVTPVKSAASGKYAIGAWIRDGTQGIGSVTYYNPKTKTFGALGHGILDVDTKKLMTVKTGELLASTIMSIQKGKKGIPGELEGDIDDNSVLGQIKANTPLGLYGYMDKLPDGVQDSLMKISLKSEIHEGPAVILANISGSETKQYDIYIESVNRFGSDSSKGMIIRITDAGLLAKTNGIVQGMSGSPIIQDGKLAGAVTHVFVQNPARGYGIFIENMLKQEANL